MSYHKRSLCRMLAEHILKSRRTEFSHTELKAKRDEFASVIPHPKAAINVSENAYYSAIGGASNLLRDENKLILFNQRGKGYKLTKTDDEKIPPTYKQLERGAHAFELVGKMTKAVDPDLLSTKTQRIIYFSLCGSVDYVNDKYKQLLETFKNPIETPRLRLIESKLRKSKVKK